MSQVKILNELDYFPENYSEARDNLLGSMTEDSYRISKRIGAKSEFFPIRGGLTTEVVVHDAKGKKENLLALITGTHGKYEGIVGSALQQQFIHKYLNKINKNTGVAFIQLNPDAYHSGRRVTKNNVDLNRAGADKPSELRNDVPVLNKISSDLRDHGFCPQRKRWINPIELAVFSYKLLNPGFSLLRKFGRSNVINSVAGGQYNDSKGIYYGGNNKQKTLEESIVHYKEIVPEITDSYDRSLFIDCGHSGLGARGSYTAIGDFIPPEEMEIMRKIFPDLLTPKKLPQDFIADEGEIGKIRKMMSEFSNVAAELFNFLKIASRNIGPDDQTLFHSQNSLDALTIKYSKSKPNKTIFLTTDFGTRNMLSVVYNMIAENQAHHYGAVSIKVKEGVDRRFREVFCPSDYEWRENVLSLSDGIFDRTCGYFELYDSENLEDFKSRMNMELTA